MLLKEELLLYQRQLGIDRWGVQAQEKLKQSSVFVAGTGGLGSPVLYYLTAAGVGNIHICDYDTIDLTNLNRQIIHDYKKIGQKKVDSAFSSLSALNPHVTINRIYEKITKSNAEKLINKSDLIIDCLDNFDARLVLNSISVKRKIPMIHAGVSELQGQISFLQPPETACLACFMPRIKKKKIIYIAGAIPGVMGSLQAVEAIKFLTGIGGNLKNKILFWDGISMRFEIVNLLKNPRCRVCSKIL